MDKLNNDTQAVPEADENRETMELFGERLDEATPCAPDTGTAEKEKKED